MIIDDEGSDGMGNAPFIEKTDPEPYQDRQYHPETGSFSENRPEPQDPELNNFSEEPDPNQDYALR